MQLDLEEVLILLYRRYNILREVSKLTDELQEAVSRGDQVSASLLLGLRADELQKHERCRESIMMMAERGPAEASAIRRLVLSDSIAAHPLGSADEKKIREIRQRIGTLVSDIQEKDRRLNERVGGNRSYYRMANH